jgi:hypothetical protein
MEHADSELDDTIVVERTEDADLDRTIVRPRRRARAAAEPLTTDAIADAIADADADAVDETVDETIVVDRSDSGDEQTIVVDRRPRLLGIEDDDDDDTDRSATRPPLEAEDDTDRTVARPRDDDADDDETITVDRAAPSVKLPPVPSLRPARVQRRRGIAPPPVPVGFAPAARAAVGPGAVDHYRRRDLAPPPAVRAAPDGGIVSTRVIDPDLPSVARRARRTAVVALAAFVGACVVSVTGLTLILLWVF